MPFRGKQSRSIPKESDSVDELKTEPISKGDVKERSVDAKSDRATQPAPPRLSVKAKMAAKKGPTPTLDDSVFKEAVFAPDEWSTFR